MKDILKMARSGKEDIGVALCEEVKKTRLAYEEAVESFDQA